MAQGLAIEPVITVAINTVEGQHDLCVFRERWQSEMLAIPRNVLGSKPVVLFPLGTLLIPHFQKLIEQNFTGAVATMKSCGTVTSFQLESS